MADTAIFDVDGTLVDSNYQHALAWYRAFRRYGIVLPLWRLHRGIGMGGDQYVPNLAGEQVEAEHGDDLRSAWTEEFDELIDEIAPFDGAHELVRAVKDRGFKVVLASSGSPKHVERFLQLVDGKEVADAWTTSEDVEKTKPAPDLVSVALKAVSGTSGVMLGDSTYDAEAAQQLDVPTVALRTGGFSVEELEAAGAVQVFDSLRDLLDRIEDTGFARPS